MILRGVCVSRQNEGAGVSLCDLLIVQDVLYQAACCLLNVCVFLREEKKALVKELRTFSHTVSVALWMAKLVSLFRTPEMIRW